MENCYWCRLPSFRRSQEYFYLGSLLIYVLTKLILSWSGSKFHIYDTDWRQESTLCDIVRGSTRVSTCSRALVWRESWSWPGVRPDWEWPGLLALAPVPVTRAGPWWQQCQWGCSDPSNTGPLPTLGHSLATTQYCNNAIHQNNTCSMVIQLVIPPFLL